MKSKMMKVTVPAIMASLAFLLEFISGDTGLAKFTIHGIPLMFTGIMFGPVTGIFTGLVTGILVQLQYPFTIATPVYAVSYILWALVPGGLAIFFKNKRSASLIFLSVIFASIAANLANTLAMLFDAKFIDDSWYSLTGVMGNWVSRIITMIIMFVPNIFLLEKSIKALYPIIVYEEITLDDFNSLEIPKIESL